MNIPLNCFVADNPVVENLVKNLAKSPEHFKSAIAAKDEMFLYPLDELVDKSSDHTLVNYFTLGKAIFETLETIVDWHFGGFAQVDSFLDFACGYGRLTRFLIEALAPEKVWASDIYAGAVEFQQQYFGVHGFHSASQTESYNLDRQFDCILACSFFSHMPERTFTPWMKVLCDRLTSRGILIFSVLGEEILPEHVQMSPTGILFSSATSESESLDKQEYGTTFVTEAFVRRVLAEINPDLSIHRLPRGMCHYQDFYIVSPGQFNPVESLKFQHHPEGYLDDCNITPTGEIQLRGLAVDFNPGGSIQMVQVWSGDRLITEIQTSQPRPDLLEHFQQPNLPLNTGWVGSIAPEQLSPQAMILLKAVNRAGLASIFEVFPVKQLMSRRQTLLELSRTEAQLQETETDLVVTRGKLEQTQMTLEQSQAKLSATEKTLGDCQTHLNSTEMALEQARNRIIAMESSKFWKLRTKWFKLKRAMGLPDQEPEDRR
ncbi:MAG: methyltransferase [Microcoleaceae cyanobacterium]